MISSISILGSTGSIGTQALDVVRRLGIRVPVIAANSNINVLEKQIREFSPKICAVADKAAAAELAVRTGDTSTKILAGSAGLVEAASYENTDMVLNSVVGIAGLEPTLAAIKSGKDIALANKETLVTGGEIVTKAARDNNVRILPVDSEHSAIFQCLQGAGPHAPLKRIILTASGGPFFGMTRAELQNITPTDALNHPNWSMGAKITVDSATMMNKGLEFIEAVWLFDVTPDMIDIVVHRESVVHSLIEYVDNSVIAQLGVPDMRIPIQYAVTYPERVESPVAELSLTDYGQLSFFKPDYETFTPIRTCMDAIRAGGLAPAVANGANEQAVALFLSGRIPFLRIGELIGEAVENCPNRDGITVDDVLAADKAAREYVLSRTA